VILRFLSALALIGLLLGGASPTRASNAIEVTRASLVPSISDSTWLLSADFYIPVSARMSEVLELGVPVHFVLEFEVSRSRWYWTDKQVVSKSRNYRLSYHPITRRYRLKFSGLSREFSSIDLAISALTRIRGWGVTELNQLDPTINYDWAVRMRLDTARLPGPLQLDVLNNQDWKLQAQWKRFKITPQTLQTSGATNAQ
jgi:hypothetical protein